MESPGNQTLLPPADANRYTQAVAINNGGQILVAGDVTPGQPGSLKTFRVLKYADDEDANGLPDDWERFYFGGPADLWEDPDDDGLANLEEFEFGTDPQKFDTDSDGRSDLAEHLDGDPETDPLIANPLAASSVPVLTEICANNEGVYTSKLHNPGGGFDGRKADWFELHILAPATGGFDMHAAGYGFRYRKEGDAQFQIPAWFQTGHGNVDSNTVFIASNTDPAGAALAPGTIHVRSNSSGDAEFYFPHKLSAEGGRLELIKSTGGGSFTVIQSMEWRNLAANESWAYDAGFSRQGRALLATPGNPNGPLHPERLALTMYDNSGFHTAPLTVGIPSGRHQFVYWTDDGSDPAAGNPAARIGRPGELIPITTTTVLRLRGCRGTNEVSDPVMRTFIFRDDVLSQQSLPGISGENNRIVEGAGDREDPKVPFTFDLTRAAANGVEATLNQLTALPTVSIGTGKEGLFGKEQGIYANSVARGAAWERTASAQFIGFPMEGNADAPCAVEISGSTSAEPEITRKHSLRLKFKRSTGAPSLEAWLFQDPGPAPGHRRHDSLVLRTPAFDTWASNGMRANASYVRNRWVQESLREWTAARTASFEALPHQPRSRPVHLFLNGLYWGVYHIEEEADSDFFKRAWSYHFGDDIEDADFDVIEDGRVKEGDGEAWKDLQETAASIRSYAAGGHDPAGLYEDVKQRLDVPQFTGDAASDRTTAISWGWDQCIRHGRFSEEGVFSFVNPAASRPRVVTQVAVSNRLGPTVQTRGTSWIQRMQHTSDPRNDSNPLPAPVIDPGTDPVMPQIHIAVVDGEAVVKGRRIVEVVDASGGNWFYVYDQPILCDGSELMDQWQGYGETGATFEPLIRWKRCRLFYPELTAGQPRLKETAEFNPKAGLADSKVTDASGNVTDYEYEDVIQLEKTQPWFRPFMAIMQFSANDLRQKIYGLDIDPEKDHLLLPKYDADPTQEIRYLGSTQVKKTFRYYSSSSGSMYENGQVTMTGQPVWEDRLRSPISRVMIESKDPVGTFAVTIFDHLTGVPLREAVVGKSRLPVNEILSETLKTYSDPRYPSFVTQQAVKKAVWKHVAGVPAGEFVDLVTQFSPGPYGNVESVTSQVYTAPETVYDAVLPAHSLSATVTTRVDSNGNREHVTDVFGKSTWFEYDVENKLLRVTNPDCGAGPETTEIRYDSRGRKAMELDELGLATLYVYGVEGKISKVIRDMNGDLLETAGDLITTSEYDPRGRLIKVTAPGSAAAPNGGITRTLYDKLNRPVRTWIDVDNDGTHDVANNSFFEPGTETFYNGANSGSGAFASSGWRPTRTVEHRRELYKNGAKGVAWRVTSYETKYTYDQLCRTVRTEVQTTATGTASPIPGGAAGPHWVITDTEYDLAGRAVKVKAPHGQHSHTTYDGLGRPLSQWASFYSTASDLQSIDQTAPVHFPVMEHYYSATAEYRSTVTSNGEMRVTETEVDPSGKPVRVRSPSPVNGQVDRNTGTDEYTGSPMVETHYDLGGKVVATVSPLGHKSTIEYDARGRVIKATAPAAPNALVHVPPAGALGGSAPAARDYTDFAAASAVTQTFYNKKGQVLKTIDPRELYTLMEYDAAGRVTKVVSGPSTINVNMELATTGSLPDVTVVRTRYDTAGNVVAVADAEGNVTLNEYDAFNRLVKTSTDPATGFASHFNAPPSPLPSTAITVENEYDSAGNVVRVTDGAGQSTRFFYDGAGRKTHTLWDPAQDRTRIEQAIYAGALLYRTIKADGEIVTPTYDRALRPVKTVFAWHPAEDRYTSYDHWGQVSEANAGYISAVSTLQNNYLRYDAAGRMIREVAGGIQSRYTYDRGGNVRKVDYGHPGSAGIDAPGNWSASDIRRSVASTYDALGRLQIMTETGPAPGNPSNTTPRESRYYYAVSGEVVRKVQPGAAGDRQFTHQTYDVRGRLLSLKTLHEVTSPAPPVEVTQSTMAYRKAGAVESVAERRAGAPLRTVTNEYDKVWRLAAENSVPASGPTGRTEWTYDRANNRTRERKLSGSTLTNDTVFTFNTPGSGGYSPSGASSDQVTDSSDSVTGETRHYEYDQNGNRSWEKITWTQSSLATGDPYCEDRNYWWDGSNRLIYITCERMDYDGANSGIFESTASFHRLTCEYAYDQRTRRVFRAETTQEGPDQEPWAHYTFLPDDVRYDYEYRPAMQWEGWEIAQSGGLSVQEYPAQAITSDVWLYRWEFPATEPEAEFVRGSDMGGGVGGILYSLRAGTGARYHAYNQRGDVVAQTASGGSGATTWAAAYDAFGNRANGYETGSTEDRHKANTHEEDPTGLINDGYRYRDPVTGTYLSRDPAGFVDGPNVYTYVRQNPWTCFDAHGLQSAAQAVNDRANQLIAASRADIAMVEAMRAEAAAQSEMRVRMDIQAIEARADAELLVRAAHTEMEEINKKGQILDEMAAATSNYGRRAYRTLQQYLECVPGFNVLNAAYASWTGKEIVTGEYTDKGFASGFFAPLDFAPSAAIFRPAGRMVVQAATHADELIVAGGKNLGSRGVRNSEDLTDAQIAELMVYAGQVGLPGKDIRFIHGPSTYSDNFDVILIGPDVLPAPSSLRRGGTVFERMSPRAVIAHEAGHLRTTRAGIDMPHGSRLLDEIQASLVGKQSPGLSQVERYQLLRDAAERAKAEKQNLRDLLPFLSQ